MLSKACVTLANIPFIRLRDDLPSQLIEGKQGFRQTVEAMRLIENPKSLELEPENFSVHCSGRKVKLGKSDYCFYHWLVCRQKNTGEMVRRPVEKEYISQYSEELLALREEIVGFVDDRTEKALKPGMDKNYFQQRVTNIKNH